METAAPDFRIFWDNAYAVHHLGRSPGAAEEHPRRLPRRGTPRSAVHLHLDVEDQLRRRRRRAPSLPARPTCAICVAGLSIQTIGHDKLNQLRHVRFFKDAAGVAAHMQRHAAILTPKFDAVDEILERELGGTGVAEWSRPQGGYFVSLDTLDGCASARSWPWRTRRASS